MVSVAVIGGGIGGLVCAQTVLRQFPAAGVQVVVYEWGRGPGGRTARRRASVDGREVGFDHAAPFFAASTDAFRQGMLRDWIERGVVAEWEGTFGTFDDHGGGRTTTVTTREDRVLFTGVPTMHSICRALADDVVACGGATLYGRQVTAAAYGTGGWRVSARHRGTGASEERTFDALVLSDKLLILPNQYAVLAPDDVGALALPSRLDSEPCVVLLVALSEETDRRHDASWDVLEGGSDDGPVRLIVHDSAKPQRAPASSPPLDLWVVHAGANYAARQLTPEQEGETPGLSHEEAVRTEMLHEFLRIYNDVGQGSTITAASVAYSSVMVWDHARPVHQQLPHTTTTHLWDPSRSAGVCGDFFTVPSDTDGEAAPSGVEVAALSGAALGSSLVPRLQALLDATTAAP